MSIARLSRMLAITVGAIAMLAGSGPDRALAEAGDAATKVIASLNAKLLDTMKQATQLGVQGRYDALSPVLSKTYDVASMSKIAVGPSWDTLQPDQKAAVVEGFTRMMVATYAKRFDGFSDEKFEVVQIADQAPTDKMVKTRIVQSNGKPVAINYLVRQTGPDWRVVDVYLDGTISELATRRAEFTAILKSGGPDALIASLRKQGDRLLSGG